MKQVVNIIGPGPGLGAIAFHETNHQEHFPQEDIWFLVFLRICSVCQAAVWSCTDRVALIPDSRRTS